MWRIPPKMWRIPPQEKGQKSKKKPRPEAVESHLKTSRKWAVFRNLWEGRRKGYPL